MYVIVSIFLIFLVVDQLLLVYMYVFSLYLTRAKKKKNNNGRLPLTIVKIMKNRQYQFKTAIYFMDFHRCPLSIDKHHLIATDFIDWLLRVQPP